MQFQNEDPTFGQLWFVLINQDFFPVLYCEWLDQRVPVDTTVTMCHEKNLSHSYRALHHVTTIRLIKTFSLIINLTYNQPVTFTTLYFKLNLFILFDLNDESIHCQLRGGSHFTVQCRSLKSFVPDFANHYTFKLKCVVNLLGKLDPGPRRSSQ